MHRMREVGEHQQELDNRLFQGHIETLLHRLHHLHQLHFYTSTPPHFSIFTPSHILHTCTFCTHVYFSLHTCEFLYLVHLCTLHTCTLCTIVHHARLSISKRRSVGSAARHTRLLAPTLARCVPVHGCSARRTVLSPLPWLLRCLEHFHGQLWLCISGWSSPSVFVEEKRRQLAEAALARPKRLLSNSRDGEKF